MIHCVSVGRDLSANISISFVLILGILLFYIFSL